MCRAVEKGLPQAYLPKAHRLIDWGLRFGYDRGVGGIFTGCRYDGSVLQPGKGYWEQAELLRALMHVAEVYGRDDLWAPLDESLALARRHFLDAEHGGWFARYDPSVPRRGQAMDKGSVWKVGYHVTGMYSEALRLLTGA